MRPAQGPVSRRVHPAPKSPADRSFGAMPPGIVSVFRPDMPALTHSLWDWAGRSSPASAIPSERVRSGPAEGSLRTRGGEGETAVPADGLSPGAACFGKCRRACQMMQKRRIAPCPVCRNFCDVSFLFCANFTTESLLFPQNRLDWPGIAPSTETRGFHFYEFCANITVMLQPMNRQLHHEIVRRLQGKTAPPRAVTFQAARPNDRG